MYSPRIPARARLFLLPFILPVIVAICPAPGAFAAGCASPEFAAAANYTVGTNPAVVAVKDFNGDGNADVAVLNQTSGNVFVFLGTGSGGFSAPLIQPVTQSVDMTAADFNGDGRLDLALAGGATTGVALLLGDGSGSFAAPVTIPASSASSRGITSGDFNGDGKIDLAVTGADFRVRVLINAGGGTFNAPNTTYTGTELSKLAAADLNGDAKLDLVVLNGSNDRNIMVMLGDGAGGLGSPQMYDVGGTPTSLVLSDLDSDQKLDVVVAVGSNVKLLRGNGNGTFASPTVIATGNGPNVGAVADFNGDGHDDLAIAFSGFSQGQSGGVGISFGDGAGGFGPVTNYVAGTGPRFVAAGDFNSDHKPDLAVANYGNSTGDPGSLSVLLDGSGGRFNAAVNYVIGNGLDDVLAADFNGDGRLDLAGIHQSPSSVGIILGDGTGGFSQPRNFAFSGFPDSAAVGDLNGDGKPDVVVTTQSPNAVYVYLGDGAGGLGAPTTFAAGAIPYGIAIEDFNGDGKKDLAVANPGSSNVSILLGNGQGGFGSATNVAIGSAPSSVAVGDFNHDGKKDLAVNGAASPNNVSILLGGGDGSFTLLTGLKAHTSPEYVAVADLNGDGKDDLAVANRVSSDVSIFLGKGDGTFFAATNVAVGGNPFNLAVGDLNGDGVADLLVPTYTLNNAAVLLGNGTGGFAQPVYYAAGQGAQYAAIGDFNGDGMNDAAVGNLLSDTVTILRNVCVASAPPAIHFGASAYTVGEGAGTVSVSVVRDGDASGSVSVGYATRDGSAAAGKDYAQTSGTLVFAPGETAKSITVAITDDAAVEGSETFFVELTNPSGGTLGIPSSTAVTIRDNDVCSYSVSPQSLPEFPAAGGQGTLQISAPEGCSWSSTSFDNWITPNPVNVPWSGNGNGSISFNILANSGPARVGHISLMGGQFYEIRQAAGGSVVFFSGTSYLVREGDGSVAVQVNRLGLTSSTTTVFFTTNDLPASVGCDVINGTAYARCDYATTVGTITFAPGETTKTVSIPIVNDSYVEGPENFDVRLLSPTGAALAFPSTATVAIIDDDTASTPNPYFNTDFFVRQQYLDFLSREPDADGFNSWTGLLNGCAEPYNSNVAPYDPVANPSALCDRLNVSANFFLSAEFQLKGGYVFRFYKSSLGRLPRYTEFTADSASVTGSTAQEVFAKKAAFADSFAQRQEFKSLYDAMTNAQFVAALMDRYGAQSIRTPNPATPDDSSDANKVTLTRADLVNRLGGTGGTLTRAQVVRAVADSDQVSGAEFNSAFVSMQYFGYLRRDPDQQGYTDWINFLSAHPGQFRTMVFGFLYSPEYKSRFGKP